MLDFLGYVVAFTMLFVIIRDWIRDEARSAAAKYRATASEDFEIRD